MDYELWAEFGDNLLKVKNLTYFPSEWEFPEDSLEKFKNYPKKYLLENNLFNIKEYNPLESKLNKETGFFSVPKKGIFINGRFFEGQYVFLKEGEIKYIQDISEDNNFIKKNQFFFDKNIFLQKTFVGNKYELFVNNYISQNEIPDLGYVKDGFEKEFIDANLSEPFLSDVHRNIHSKIYDKICLDFNQLTSTNARLSLKSITDGKLIDLTIDSTLGTKGRVSLSEIKKDPSILFNIKKLNSLIGGIKVNEPFIPNGGFIRFKDVIKRMVGK